jgi:hypothetical protein
LWPKASRTASPTLCVATVPGALFFSTSAEASGAISAALTDSVSSALNQPMCEIRLPV